METILRRLREPSTYAGIAALIVAAKAFLPAADSIAQSVVVGGTAVAGLLAIWLPERPSA